HGHLVGGLLHSAGGRAEKDLLSQAPRRAADPTAHLMRSRRLVRDFERSTNSAEAMVYWSMTLLMTRRLARPRPSRA
ncbi:hypothetical protein ACIO3N_40190, partial [Kitasatospora aureofaciens]